MDNLENVATPPQFKVKRIPEGNNLYSALGVTEERAMQMAVIIREAVKESNDFVTAISKATEKAESIEEIAFMAYTIGAFSQRNDNPLAALAAMLR
jgi:hypothetical protein